MPKACDIHATTMFGMRPRLCATAGLVILCLASLFDRPEPQRWEPPLRPPKLAPELQELAQELPQGLSSAAAVSHSTRTASDPEPVATGAAAAQPPSSRDSAMTAAAAQTATAQPATAQPAAAQPPSPRNGLRIAAWPVPPTLASVPFEVTPLPFALKNCSAGVFRHLAKTGGSTIQAVWRRAEQLGDFYYASFGTWVEIRPSEFSLLMREVRADFDAFLRRHPRMLISFHKQTAEQFAPWAVQNHVKQRDPAFRIWEDVLELRRLYRSRGCGFVLATVLRQPDPGLYVSDFLFEGARRGRSFFEGGSPWIGRDIQAAGLLGWPFGWNAKRELTAAHERQAFEVLDEFDLVGVTERFTETLLLLARALGLPHAQYRRMNRGTAAAARKAELLADAAVREAIRRSSAFDTRLYEHYAARFERGLAQVDAPFRAVMRAFAARVVRRGEHDYVGGLPPLDRYMVTSRYTCPSPFGGRNVTDYGGCEVRLGQPGGPQTLADTKTYVPCEQARCTKIAADGFACARWKLEPPEPDERLAAGAPSGSALQRRGAHVVPVDMQICKTIHSPPDGFT